MAFTVEKLPDEPIIVITFRNPSNPTQDYGPLLDQVAKLCEGLEGPIYRITDLRQVNFSFSDMVVAIAEEFKSGKPGSAADPRIRTVLAASGELVKLAAESVKQEQYGARNDTPMFTSLDEAIAYSRAELAKKPEESA